MAFSQSKYYVDSLSENTKRGLTPKSSARTLSEYRPLGYINDVRKKTIIVDKRRSPFVIETYRLYAVGDKTLQDIADFLASKGIMTKGKNRSAKTKSNTY